MKLLLDENLPKRLKRALQEHEVSTVRDEGWAGIKNGHLLQLLITAGFEALVTFDKNLQHQQNLNRYPIAVIVLVAPNNKYVTLERLIPQMRVLLSKPLTAGVHLLKLPN